MYTPKQNNNEVDGHISLTLSTHGIKLNLNLFNGNHSLTVADSGFPREGYQPQGRSASLLIPQMGIPDGEQVPNLSM